MLIQLAMSVCEGRKTRKGKVLQKQDYGQVGHRKRKEKGETIARDGLDGKIQSRKCQWFEIK